MNENNEKLLKLVQENPDLPIVPMVYTEVVESDDFEYWHGSFGECRVGEFIIYEMYKEKSIVFKEDAYDKILDDLLRSKYNDEDRYADEEAERLAKEEIDNLKWIKAIIVFIELPTE